MSIAVIYNGEEYELSTNRIGLFKTFSQLFPDEPVNLNLIEREFAVEFPERIIDILCFFSDESSYTNTFDYSEGISLLVEFIEKNLCEIFQIKNSRIKLNLDISHWIGDAFLYTSKVEVKSSLKKFIWFMNFSRWLSSPDYHRDYLVGYSNIKRLCCNQRHYTKIPKNDLGALSLESLVVSENGAPRYVKGYPNLKELDCSWSHCLGIKAGDSGRLSLEKLSLNGNKSVPRFIQGYPNLKILNCLKSSCVGISDGDLGKESLEELDLTFNMSAPREIEGYPNLKKLKCRDSLCVGIKNGDLGKENLKELDLSYNINAPLEIEGYSNLKILNCYRSSCVGIKNGDLGKKSLRVLNLTGNEYVRGYLSGYSNLEELRCNVSKCAGLSATNSGRKSLKILSFRWGKYFYAPTNYYPNLISCDGTSRSLEKTFLVPTKPYNSFKKQNKIVAGLNFCYQWFLDTYTKFLWSKCGTDRPARPFV